MRHVREHGRSSEVIDGKDDRKTAAVILTHQDWKSRALNLLLSQGRVPRCLVDQGGSQVDAIRPTVPNASTTYLYDRTNTTLKAEQTKPHTTTN